MADPIVGGAQSDLKLLTDDQLKAELSNPTGMTPGYAVMAELQDRNAMRIGQYNPDPPSMKDEMLQSPSRQYSKGGMIGQLNPLDTIAKVMRNPQLAGGYLQDQINSSSGGLPALQAAQAAAPAQELTPLSSLQAPASNAPAVPQRYAMGGLMSLRR